MKTNMLLNTDSYKASMLTQYPPNTQTVYSYIESRGGRYKNTVFFGLQAFIKEYLMTPFDKNDIDEAEEMWAAHGEPWNRAQFDYVLSKFGGYWPVRIRAVAEGSVVPTQNILLDIENVGGEATRLFTTYLETALLRAIWYPTTVATNSREIKKVIRKYLVNTGSDLSGLPFKLHDFGARGASSYETSMLGGMAHLVNFMGTDTISATVGASRFYREKMAGFSIPAAEHSTITSWGRDNEVEAYRNMIRQFAKPGAIFAVVSDSYDIYNAVENLWGDALRQDIADSGATLVVRPDSGNPVEVVTRVAQLLAERFGYTTNQKGFKLLNNVRVIQGDGVNIDSITAILQNLQDNGFAADNLAFGMGGALLGAPQRDDQKFAMKCSAVQIGDQWVDVYKDPITDPGKTSKKGRLELVFDGGLGSESYKTIPSLYVGKRNKVLRTVYEPGKLLVDDSFEEIRERAQLTEIPHHRSMYDED